MKNFILLTVFGLFLCVVNTPVIQAQDNEGPTMFLVFEESVAPENMPEFVKVQSEAFEKFDELNFDMTISAYRLQDFSFYWAMPLENFASIDALFAKFMKNQQLLMENGYDPVQKFRGLSSLSHFVVNWNKDLSYYPADYKAPEEPDIYYEWTFVHLKYGHEKEAADIIKKYQELYDSVEDTYQWDVYEVVLGNKTPCWILESQAKSEIEMRTIENNLNSKYGEQFNELWTEFVKHVDEMGNKKGWFLPGWSRYHAE